MGIRLRWVHVCTRFRLEISRSGWIVQGWSQYSIGRQDAIFTCGGKRKWLGLRSKLRTASNLRPALGGIFPSGSASRRRPCRRYRWLWNTDWLLGYGSCGEGGFIFRNIFVI